MRQRAVLGGIIAAAVLIGLVALIVLNRSDQLKAEMVITTGSQPGQKIKSTLQCQGGSAKGTGMYRLPARARAGCAQINKLKAQLAQKQASCPEREQAGPRTLVMKGEVDGQKFYFDQQNQITCPERINQLTKLTPLVNTAQQTPPAPSFTVIIPPPPPPPLTAEAQRRASQQIKQKGWRRYQLEQALSLNKLKGSGDQLKPCPRPLPEVYTTCYVQVKMRPDENQTEAFKRAYKENPDWFNNNSIPRADTPVAREIRQKQRSKAYR